MQVKINEYEEEVHLEVSLGENVKEEVFQGFFYRPYSPYTMTHPIVIRLISLGMTLRAALEIRIMRSEFSKIILVILV